MTTHNDYKPRVLTQKEIDYLLFLREQRSGYFGDIYHGYVPKCWPNKDGQQSGGHFFTSKVPPIPGCFITGFKVPSKMQEGDMHHFNLSGAGKIVADTLYSLLKKD